jgi:transitional endoplasmic reticulum ATPase
MTKLVLINEGTNGVEVELKAGTTTIGRSENNSVAIEDGGISTRHCELILTGQEVRVRDLQSTNGTFIDEKPITDAPLRPGQILRVGGALFRLETDGAASKPAGAAPATRLLEGLQQMAFAQKRVPLLIRAISGLMAGWLVVFVTGSLPFYSVDWRLLGFLLVTAAWILRPVVGKFAALAVCLVPIAYYTPLLLTAAGVGFLVFQSPYALLVLGGMSFALVEPAWRCLTPIVPLAVGFLGVRAGLLAAGGGCVMAEIMERLGLAGSSSGFLASAPPLAGLLSSSSPLFKGEDWPGGPPGWAGEVFRPFLQQPSLLGQVLVWAAVAAVTGWQLRQPLASRFPPRVTALVAGTFTLLIGNLVLACGFTSSGLTAASSAFSVLVSGALVALVSPALEPVVKLLGKERPARSGVMTVYGGQGPAAGGPFSSPREVPPDVWDDLAGVDDIREEVQDALQTQFDPGVRASLERLKLQPVRGILLFGPSGTGKTKLARIIAHEAGASFFAVSGTEFTSKFFGESEANLRHIFEAAGEHRPTVLFFDELEAFLPKRAEMAFSDAAQRGIVATFLAYTDGIAALDGVLLVGATNYPDLIDPAALRPGRFDKLIYVSAPDAGARRAIFKTCLRGKTLAGDVDFGKLAERTERFTGADIQGVCKEASLAAMRAGGDSPPGLSDFLTLISGAKPSVTYQMEREYQKIADQFCRRSRKPERVEVIARNVVGWEDVVGLEEAKNALRETIEMPLAHEEVLKQYGVKPSKGVLLYGPPGCGKTLLGKVVARQSKAHFLHVKGPELLRGNSGESEAKLRELFDRARENAPCVLFFDELDALAGARGTADATGTGILNQFLAEMDGVDELKGVVVLGATNRPEAIDPALRRPGRFDRLVYVPPPNAAARAALFAHELHGKPLSQDLDLPALANLTDGYSSADIANLCNSAAIEAAKETIRTGVRQQISTPRLQELIARMPSSIKPGDLAVYEAFRGR